MFERKEVATLAQRIEILDWHNANGNNQTKTARFWPQKYPNLCLKQPLVSSWVKEETRWREHYAAASGATDHKRVRQTVHPTVNAALELWMQKAMRDELIVTGDVLRAQWIKFADMEGVAPEDRLELSEGWLTSLKTRTGIKNRKKHGEAAATGSDVVEEERARMKALLVGYALRDIYNMDETGLFYG